LVQGAVFSSKTTSKIVRLLKPLVNSPYKTFLIKKAIPKYEKNRNDLLSNRIGVLAHDIIEYLTIDYLRSLGVSAFHEIYGDKYYYPEKGEKRRFFRMDLNIIRNNEFIKRLETTDGKLPHYIKEIAIDFTLTNKDKHIIAKFLKGYQSKKDNRYLLVVLYGEKSDDTIKDFRKLAAERREDGEHVDVITFSEYKELLSLETLKNKFHLDRFNSFNNLVDNAFGDPEAYERLYYLYKYYNGQLPALGTSQKDYDIYRSKK